MKLPCSRPLVFFGTCNLDFCLLVDRLPSLGGSVVGSLSRNPGGKGANQAVAAARLGHTPRFFTRLGDDDVGVALRHALKEAGVSVEMIDTVPGGTSGTALIMVDAAGANIIGIEPGANNSTSPEDIQRAAAGLKSDAIVVAEMGLPNAALECLFALKRQRNFELIFNPAPVRSGLSREAWSSVDYLTPNETEAFDLTGIEVVDSASSVSAADAILDLGVRAVVITLGSRGAFYANALGRRVHVPAFEVAAVDTTAAGDAFNGGFAAALAQGAPIEEALRYAMAVAALCVTQRGAQSSMPTAQAVAEFLAARTELENQ